MAASAHELYVMQHRSVYPQPLRHQSRLPRVADPQVPQGSADDATSLQRHQPLPDYAYALSSSLPMASAYTHAIDYDDIDENDTSSQTTPKLDEGRLRGRKKRFRPNHNELERKRRSTQKIRTQDLKDIIPTLQSEKPSTILIVTKAKEYIEILHRRIEELEMELVHYRPSPTTNTTSTSITTSSINPSVHERQQQHHHHHITPTHSVPPLNTLISTSNSDPTTALESISNSPYPQTTRTLIRHVQDGNAASTEGGSSIPSSPFIAAQQPATRQQQLRVSISYPPLTPPLSHPNNLLPYNVHQYQQQQQAVSSGQLLDETTAHHQQHVIHQYSTLHTLSHNVNTTPLHSPMSVSMSYQQQLHPVHNFQTLTNTTHLQHYSGNDHTLNIGMPIHNMYQQVQHQYPQHYQHQHQQTNGEYTHTPMPHSTSGIDSTPVVPITDNIDVYTNGEQGQSHISPYEPTLTGIPDHIIRARILEMERKLESAPITSSTGHININLTTPLSLANYAQSSFRGNTASILVTNDNQRSLHPHATMTTTVAPPITLADGISKQSNLAIGVPQPQHYNAQYDYRHHPTSYYPDQVKHYEEIQRPQSIPSPPQPPFPDTNMTHMFCKGDSNVDSNFNTMRQDFFSSSRRDSLFLSPRSTFSTSSTPAGDHLPSMTSSPNDSAATVEQQQHNSSTTDSYVLLNNESTMADDSRLLVTRKRQKPVAYAAVAGLIDLSTTQAHESERREINSQSSGTLTDHIPQFINKYTAKTDTS